MALRADRHAVCRFIRGERLLGFDLMSQHVEIRFRRVAAFARALEDAFARIGRVRPEIMLPPIEGPAWGYRHRARLSVRHVPKKGGVLIGFHERKSSFVADMTECHVLPAHISRLLPALRL